MPAGNNGGHACPEGILASAVAPGEPRSHRSHSNIQLQIALKTDWKWIISHVGTQPRALFEPVRVGGGGGEMALSPRSPGGGLHVPDSPVAVGAAFSSTGGWLRAARRAPSCPSVPPRQRRAGWWEACAPAKEPSLALGLGAALAPGAGGLGALGDRLGQGRPSLALALGGGLWDGSAGAQERQKASSAYLASRLPPRGSFPGASPAPAAPRGGMEAGALAGARGGGGAPAGSPRPPHPTLPPVARSLEGGQPWSRRGGRAGGHLCRWARGGEGPGGARLLVLPLRPSPRGQ